MKFRDIRACQRERFSIGIEEDSGKYYLSIPVANGLVDYEEFYEITDEEFANFNVSAGAALNFFHECRIRQQDDRLIIKPGSDRGVAI